MKYCVAVTKHMIHERVHRFPLCTGIEFLLFTNRFRCYELIEWGVSRITRL